MWGYFSGGYHAECQLDHLFSNLRNKNVYIEIDGGSHSPYFGNDIPGMKFREFRIQPLQRI